MRVSCAKKNKYICYLLFTVRRFNRRIMIVQTLLQNFCNHNNRDFFQHQKWLVHRFANRFANRLTNRLWSKQLYIIWVNTEQATYSASKWYCVNIYICKYSLGSGCLRRNTLYRLFALYVAFGHSCVCIHERYDTIQINGPVY